MATVMDFPHLRGEWTRRISEYIETQRPLDTENGYWVGIGQASATWAATLAIDVIWPYIDYLAKKLEKFRQQRDETRAELTTLTQRVDRLDEFHTDWRGFCNACGGRFPCLTLRVLRGEADG